MDDVEKVNEIDEVDELDEASIAGFVQSEEEYYYELMAESGA
ncbi:1769_t:CDS:2 [Dentiscutata heterogama]|uniref:1769_t:CDS:1 n=1 Tax=Dentiscutata heterogama TaxID=1316150 RepID=A0ACA9MX35_9GLOM|nr:1769_t:CDS:2 [Dentiscutata heterogama]